MSSVSEFLKTFVEALGIVLLVSFLTLGLRTGIVVALSVPLVLAIVFIVMYAAGLDLHRITLGALIIALGLLVDDAIIAIEMMVVKMEQGFDRARAATFAWTSTAFPMLTGTLVTAAGFLPVGFANSSTGEYAGGIFWVVGLALIASWFVAVLFTPYLGVKLLPDFAKRVAARRARTIRKRSTTPASIARCGGVIELCLRWRKTVVAATVLMFATAIAAFGLVQQQFFPTSTRTELFFEMRLPEGTAIGVTDAAAKKAESLLTGDPDIVTYTSYVGQGAPRFWLGLNPVLPNANFAQIVIVTKDLQARERVKARLEKALADGALPEARTRVDRFVFGPPVGYPVQFRVIGPDPLKVREIAEEVRKVMARESQAHRSASRLERAGEVDPARGRPGSRPRARPDAAGRGADAADAALRLDRDAVPRRHRDHRRGGARGVRRAARPRPAAEPDDLHAQRRRGAAVADRADQLRVRGADPVAAQSRSRAHRARRHRRRRAGAGRQQRGAAEAAADQGCVALRLPHRDRRRDRGKREGERLARRGLPGDGGGDAGDPDDPAAELLAARAGVRHRAARHHRRRPVRCSFPTGRSASSRCSA